MGELMRKYLICILIVTLFLTTSCSKGAGKTFTNYNEDIDIQIQNEIKSLETVILKAIADKDLGLLTKNSTETFIQSAGDLNNGLTQLNDAMKDMNIVEQDKFYFKTDQIGNYEITSLLSKSLPFIVTISAYNEESFVSTLKSNSGVIDYLLTFVYTKEGTQWKLNGISIGDYTYGGMTAIDYYSKAKQFKEKNYMVPAALLANITNKLLRPAPFIQYKAEPDIISFGNTLYEELNKEFKFPYKLKENSNIELIALDINYLTEGLIPVIKYKTDLNLDNITEIEKEANVIKDEVLNLYPGMKESFDQFLFQAYSEYPTDSNKTYKFYGTIIVE
jgi:hypothetical protein